MMERPQPGSVTKLLIGYEENGDSKAAAVAKEFNVEAVIGADIAAHVSLLRETVREEVALALEQRGMDPESMAKKVDAYLELVGLKEFAAHHPAKLSGGQTKRLVCASLAVAEPDILIIVEPFVGLDPDSRKRIDTLLHSLPHTAVVTVCHDNSAADAPLPPVSSSVAGARARAGAGARAGARACEEEVLAGISARRGGQKRRWWQIKEDKTPAFSIGPVDIPVAKGTVTWLRGDNGSGKTSLLRSLAGLEDDDRYAARVALALQSPMDQVIDSTVSAAIGDETLVEELGLDGTAHPLDLSISQLRVIQIAGALALGRDILVLDEPDTLVDSEGRHQVHRLIHRALTRGDSVIVTCHEPRFVEAVGTYAQVREVRLPAPGR